MLEKASQISARCSVAYLNREKGHLLKRTISFMTGKGSVNHNSRKFHAKNTDPERSYLNVEYCNENIKDVYYELFDEALARIMKSRPEVIAGLMITMRKSDPASRKSHSMRLFCRLGIRTIRAQVQRTDSL